MPLSAEDQAALESIISKILDKKLDGILTTKADTMAGEIREEMKSGMETLMKTGLDTFVKQQDVVNATFKTDVVDLKRRTKTLPMDGDMIGFVKTQVDRAQIVESLNFVGVITYLGFGIFVLFALVFFSLDVSFAVFKNKVGTARAFSVFFFLTLFCLSLFSSSGIKALESK